MSGFEIVGVILGVYPLIIGVLDVYKATKGEKGAISLARQLKTEEIIFKEFVYHLTEANVSDTKSQYKASSPVDVVLWRNTTFQSDLGRRLGAAKADNLIAILEEIQELLTSLQQELTPSDQGVDLLRKFRSRMRQVRLNLPQSSLRERLEHLTTYNTQLQRLLTDRSLPNQRPFHQRPGSPRRYLWRDRSHAIDIYNALCGGYSCECTVPHRANFGLPKITDKIRTDSGLLSAWQFDLLFAIEESVGTEVMPAGSDDLDELTKSWSHSSIGDENVHSSRRFSVSQCDDKHDRAQQKLISDLCIFTKSPNPGDCEHDRQVCILRLKEKQYSLQSPSTLQVAPHNVQYLDQLLDDKCFLISRKERICLALSLSHAVLSFHSTPWIEACWNWNDFCIDRKNEGQLFAARKFYSSQSQNLVPYSQRSPTSDFWAIRGEPTLTRLGFALVELALGKRLVELRSYHQSQSSDPDTQDFLTAMALVDSGWIMQAESQAYEDVVRACLKHQFISNSDVIGLDSSRSSFQENAERSIISPLHTIVVASWGSP